MSRKRAPRVPPNQPMLPIAIVHGEPLSQAPAALYIPPSALRLMLEDFEGPMDLLLFLVRKHKFNIMDIPMSVLCRQYDAYVEDIVRRDLEIAADYLTMSALLVEIKTKMLLPRPPQEEEEEEDNRADFVRRLLEYDQIRSVAQELAKLPRRERDFISPRVPIDLSAAALKPTLQSSQLASAYARVMSRRQNAVPYLLRRYVQISLREMMSDVLRRLKGGASVSFRQLAKPREGGITFLALLQMAVEKMVALRQEEDNAELYITIKDEKNG